MEVIISTKGQVVIPKELRERMQWGPGQRLEVDAGAGGLVLRKKEDKKKRPVSEIVGCLNQYAIYPIPTDEEMKAAIGEGIAKKYRESLK